MGGRKRWWVGDRAATRDSGPDSYSDSTIPSDDHHHHHHHHHHHYHHHHHHLALAGKLLTTTISVALFVSFAVWPCNAIAAELGCSGFPKSGSHPHSTKPAAFMEQGTPLVATIVAFPQLLIQPARKGGPPPLRKNAFDFFYT